MPLTFETITQAVAPIHIIIAHCENRDAKTAGIALHNFVDGAKRFSVQFAQALQLYIDTGENKEKADLNYVFLASYQEALEKFCDEIQNMISLVAAIAKEKDLPELQMMCSVVTNALDEIRVADRPSGFRKPPFTPPDFSG